MIIPAPSHLTGDIHCNRQVNTRTVIQLQSLDAEFDRDVISFLRSVTNDRDGHVVEKRLYL
jgi:hypothetical protein